MEDILTQFLNSGPVGIIAAAVVYLVIARWEWWYNICLIKDAEE
jgi:hypothetical protein